MKSCTTFVPNISYHLKNIFHSGELSTETGIKEILIPAQNGVRGLSEGKIKYYNLDVIISVGYRVNSILATNFRIWATKVLKEFMVKGFVLDDERLKKGSLPRVLTMIATHRSVMISTRVYKTNLNMLLSEKQQLKSLPRVRMPSIPQWVY